MKALNLRMLAAIQLLDELIGSLADQVSQCIIVLLWQLVHDFEPPNPALRKCSRRWIKARPYRLFTASVLIPN